MKKFFNRRDVPAAAPHIPGPQGCPMCGHVAPTRGAMLAHYKEVHRIPIRDEVRSKW